MMDRPVWPGGKKCAAAVTVNLNAELFWLALDPECEMMPKTLSLGQYGMTRGLDRILEALESRGLKGTFFVPGWVCERYGGQIRDIAERGHEIASLGYGNENMALYTREEQRGLLEKSLKSIRECCNVVPEGFRAPDGELTEETLEIAAELGFTYSSSLHDDDRPYTRKAGNTTIVEIPIHWDNYDLPYFAFNYHPAFPAGQGRIMSYEGALSNWIDYFDGCREYGLCYVFQTDPAASGSPGRIELFEELLDHIISFDDVWTATCGEIQRYYIGNRLYR
ncbi:MAG TPA: polysaccharide deacetylase [Candidatus Avanaerovorax faecigallinarum]|nr:polysaccharide deacetylase [Candidatus Avanaerovorax faecigallinarum]